MALAAGCSVPGFEPPLAPPDILRFEVQASMDAALASWSVQGEVDHLEVRLANQVFELSRHEGSQLLPTPPDGLFRLKAVGPGGVTESRTQLVSPTATPVELPSFSVVPTRARPDEPVIVTWTSKQARRVVLLVDAVEVADLAPSGRTVLRPTTSALVTVRAEGLGGPITRSTHVEVNEAPPLIRDFTPDRSEVVAPQAVTWRWSVERASSVRWVALATTSTLTELDGLDPMGSLKTTLPPGLHRFRLEALGGGAIETAEASVRVLEETAPSIRRFVVDPVRTGYGGDVLVRWEVGGAHSLSLVAGDNTPVIVDPIGQDIFRIDQIGPQVFELIATRDMQVSRRVLTVEVDTQSPQITSFRVSPNPAEIGRPIHMSWSVLGADQICIENDVGQLLVPCGLPTPGLATIVAPPPGWFRLVTSNASGTTSRWLSFESGVAPQILRFLPLELEVRVGRPVRWSFEVGGADERVLILPGRLPLELEASEGLIAMRRSGVLSKPDATLISRAIPFTETATASLNVLPQATGSVEQEPNDTQAVAHSLIAPSNFQGRVDPTDVDLIALDLGGFRRLHIVSCHSGLRLEAQRQDSEGALIGPTAVLDPTPCPVPDGWASTFGHHIGLRVSRSNSSEAGSINYLLQLESVPATCGDGVTDVNEDCDDGNADFLDGCTPSCFRENIDELEPNDFRAQPTQINPGATRGYLSGLDDWFEWEVTRTGRWRILLTDPDGLGCSLAASLSLYIESGALVDSASPLYGCPVLDGPPTVLRPGRYQIQISGGDGQVLSPRGPYRLSVTEVP